MSSNVNKMILPIVLYGARVLREKSVPIEDPTHPKVQEFIANLYETMHQAQGIGLSAPQVGYAVQAFVVDATPLYDEEENPDESVKDFVKTFINPEITEYKSEKTDYEEGCLSIPGVRANVIRPETIRIKFYDEKGNFHEEEYSGMVARIIQHEYDHLQGILFTDYIKGLKKQLLKTKLNRILKGKTKANYKVIPKEKSPLFYTIY